MKFTVRPPRPSEWPICRMLLPDAFKTNGKPEFRLAVCEDSPHVIGALSFRRSEEAIQSVMVHVPAANRRQGIGKTLLHQIIAEAGQEGCREVTSLLNITSEPAGEAFLLKNCFVKKEILHTVEGDMAFLREKILPIRNRMIASGRIPASVRLFRVNESNREAVLQLYADHIAVNRRHIHIPSMKLGPADLVHSQALAVNDRIEGMILGNALKGICTVSALAVSPPYRHGWANVLLLAASLESAWAAGIRRFRFDFLESNTVMRNFRRGMETVRTMVSFVRPFM